VSAHNSSPFFIVIDILLYFIAFFNCNFQLKKEIKFADIMCFAQSYTKCTIYAVHTERNDEKRLIAISIKNYAKSNLRKTGYFVYLR